MTRDELVEKVAEALYEAHPWGDEDAGTNAWESIPEEWRDVDRKQATAAIRLIVEECARVAEVYIIEQNSIHPDVPFERLSDQAKTIAHTTCQHVALSIRSLLPEESST